MWEGLYLFSYPYLACLQRSCCVRMQLHKYNISSGFWIVTRCSKTKSIKLAMIRWLPIYPQCPCAIKTSSSKQRRALKHSVVTDDTRLCFKMPLRFVKCVSNLTSSDEAETDVDKVDNQSDDS